MSTIGILVALIYAISAAFMWYSVGVLQKEFRLRNSLINAVRGLICPLPILLISGWLYGWPTVTLELVIWVSIAIALNIVVMFVTLHAFRQCGVSQGVTIRAPAPIVALVASWLLLGRSHVPSWYGIGGALLVVLGVYLFHSHRRADGTRNAFKTMWELRGTWLLYTVLMSSIVGTLFVFDRKLVIMTNPLWPMAFIGVVVWGGVATGWACVEWRDNARTMRAAWSGRLLKILGLLTFTNFMALGLNGILAANAFASSAGAAKRLDLIPSIFLAWLWLEAGPLRTRLLGATCMALGAILIGLEKPPTG